MRTLQQATKIAFLIEGIDGDKFSRLIEALTALINLILLFGDYVLDVIDVMEQVHRSIEDFKIKWVMSFIWLRYTWAEL